jgi:acyl-CoA reductase-like NAD-dependent aldehyde dehydrogenase
VTDDTFESTRAMFAMGVGLLFAKKPPTWPEDHAPEWSRFANTIHTFVENLTSGTVTGAVNAVSRGFNRWAAQHPAAFGALLWQIQDALTEKYPDDDA